ncbi:MAG: CBS domain-containing protein [Bacillota bacterium]
MHNEKKIGDIMIPLKNFATVPANAGFKEVISTLKSSLTENNNGMDALLVYDNNIPAGIISQEEILNTIRPQLLKDGTYRGWTVNNEWVIPVFWNGLFTVRCIEATVKKAGEIMKPLVFIVTSEDPLIKAVYGMSKYQVRYLPVTHHKIISGIVRQEELFLEICGLVCSEHEQVHTIDKLPTGIAI